MCFLCDVTSYNSSLIILVLLCTRYLKLPSHDDVYHYSIYHGIAFIWCYIYIYIHCIALYVVCPLYYFIACSMFYCVVGQKVLVADIICWNGPTLNKVCFALPLPYPTLLGIWFHPSGHPICYRCYNKSWSMVLNWVLGCRLCFINEIRKEEEGEE